MEWLAAYFGFQTVNNRCVWERCLVKQEGAASKQKVTMTTFKQHEENDWPQQKCYRTAKAQDNAILYTIVDGDR